jgi:hypothetical protein
MFLVDPKVFRFVVKGVKAIFLGDLIKLLVDFAYAAPHTEKGTYMY